MGLTRYKCQLCNKEQLAFPNEGHRLLINNKCSFSNETHGFIAQPPNPVTVHATNSFMSTELMLDSIWTIHDLDRQLNFEVSDEKDTKMFNDFRTSI